MRKLTESIEITMDNFNKTNLMVKVESAKLNSELIHLIQKIKVNLINTKQIDLAY